MKLPGIPGMAINAAAHVIGNNQGEQPPHFPTPELTMATVDGVNPPQVYLQSSVESATRAFADVERHRRNRTAIKCGTTLLALGGSAALILYSCSSPAERTPGGHSVAVVESPNEVLKNVKFTSDTRIGLLKDANGSTKARGLDYYCPPWPMNLIACAPTSVHTARVSVTEDIELLAPKGALTMDAEMSQDNKPTVTIHVDPTLLEANPQGAVAVVDDSTYGAQWMKNRFGTTEETMQFKAAVSRYTQDRLTDDCVKSVVDSGKALETAIADAGRQKILDVAPTLHKTDPAGEKLLDQMGSPDTAYIIDLGNKAVEFHHEDMYKPGQKLKIGGMDISFTPSHECNLGPKASQYLGDKANDPTVQVVNAVQ